MQSCKEDERARKGEEGRAREGVRTLIHPCKMFAGTSATAATEREWGGSEKKECAFK